MVITSLVTLYVMTFLASVLIAVLVVSLSREVREDEHA